MKIQKKERQYESSLCRFPYPPNKNTSCKIKNNNVMQHVKKKRNEKRNGILCVDRETRQQGAGGHILSGRNESTKDIIASSS